MHFKRKLCSYPKQPSDQKSFASGSWICLLTSTSLSLLYDNHNLFSLARSCFIVVLNFPKGMRCKCEHWIFPIEWKEQGSQKSKFLQKMTLIPHAEILYFNPQVYVWQTCVWKRPWSPTGFLQWFTLHKWNCLLHRSSGVPWSIFLRASKLNNHSPKTLDMHTHTVWDYTKDYISSATFPNLSVLIYPSQFFVLHLKCCTVPKEKYFPLFLREYILFITELPPIKNMWW